MRPWAQWTARCWLARTALVAVGFAAASAGLSGVALAAAGDGNPSGSSGSVLSGNQIGVPVSVPAAVCGISGALLGVAGAGCSGGVTSVTTPETAGPTASSSAAASPSAAGSASARTSASGNSAGTAQVGTGQTGTGKVGSVQAGSGNQLSVPVSVPADICGNAVAVLGDSTAGCAGRASASTVLAPVSGLAPGSGAAGDRGGSHGNSSTTSLAQPGAGDPADPATSQLAGIGTLPGLADLPPSNGSTAGVTTMPAANGNTGGGVPMPATALSAANAPGMSSNSFAALAVGALLAGASALKIAGRRVRDRRTGME